MVMINEVHSHCGQTVICTVIRHLCRSAASLRSRNFAGQLLYDIIVQPASLQNMCICCYVWYVLLKRLNDYWIWLQAKGDTVEVLITNLMLLLLQWQLFCFLLVSVCYVVVLNRVANEDRDWDIYKKTVERQIDEPFPQIDHCHGESESRGVKNIITWI